MAGPLSSDEIEDVVSSVRRLVSNEQNPRTLSRDLSADRLLLTPALRVVPETSPLAPLVLDGLLPDKAVETADDPVSTEASAFMEVLPDTDPQIDDVSASGPPLDAIVPPVPGMSAVSDLGGEIDPADLGTWEDEIWAEPGTISLGEAALAAEDAEVLTAPPENVDGADATVPATDTSGDWAGDGPVPFVPVRRRADLFAGSLAALAATPEVPAAKALEAVPDGADLLPKASPIPSAAVEVPSNARPTHLATEFLDEDGTPLSVLDEAALQDIVRQILRVELQGELGERITRNVRKLVRAEINRALIARDLD
jgi:hypothetical protein